jgi:GDP-D-mannose dehydratase
MSCTRNCAGSGRLDDVDNLLTNPAKAKMKFGWQSKTSAEDMIADVLDADLKRAMDSSSRV